MDKALTKDEEMKEDEGHDLLDDEIVGDSDESEDEVIEVKAQPEPKKMKVLITYIKGETRAERVSQINELSLDLRPTGRVKAIVKSPNFEKE